MIIVKDLRVDVLGEPLFEKVNLVVRSGERVGVLGTQASEVSAFLRVLAGEVEMDDGSVSLEGEQVAYLSPEKLQEGPESLARVLQTRPTFLFLDVGSKGSPAGNAAAMALLRGFRGGVVIASEDAQLMAMAKVTRILEVYAATRSVSSYTGTFADYLIEREKNQARSNEAYEKQQKQKRRLEGWLEQKREEAATNRSPERGATIRSKAKYLQREILDKEIPKPSQSE